MSARPGSADDIFFVRRLRNALFFLLGNEVGDPDDRMGKNWKRFAQTEKSKWQTEAGTTSTNGDDYYDDVVVVWVPIYFNYHSCCISFGVQLITFSTNICSGTCVEHNFDCSLFKSVPHPAEGSDQRVFQGPVEPTVHFYRIRAVESILGQMFECDLHIHLDIHGRFRNGVECWIGQSIWTFEWWFDANQRRGTLILEYTDAVQPFGTIFFFHS